MDNYKLLRKYKIKLSIFFALFVMLSFYLIQCIYIGIQYVTNNINSDDILQNKLSGIINIIENKKIYYDQIESKDKTLQKIIVKSLENSNVYKNGEKIINFTIIEPKNITKLGIYNEFNQKFLIADKKIENDTYKIVLNTENPYTLIHYFKDIIFFSIFLIPFFILFFIACYYFVGKYFKVIEETIHSLEDFTSNINHEMKTPLTEIISTLSLAKKIKNYEESIDISLLSAYKLNKILDSIIGIANLSNISYRKEKFDLIQEINNIIKDLKPKIDEKNITIQKKYTPKSYYLKINKEHFYLCMKNIISNAIKYSNEGGIIEIGIKNGEIEIKDYGIGIDKNNLKNIFNRYFRENYNSEEGLGIGLAIVKKIIDINNWKINIESEKNIYTKININFL
ncbi:MAG: HAMP domain-containing sensor histidine kinase [Candidatus Gracilibacteria bacterium]|nr:HAMP domain-containing sensor histidine kinase [Candidatus Gracilibacteria bacterium]